MNFNEKLALQATKIFGSIRIFYLFALSGAIPAVFPNLNNQYLAATNWISLVALPLIMLGQNLLGKNIEQRDQETHDTVIQELAELKEIHLEIHSMIKGGQ